ncbi:MAG: hypothetical protein Q7T04_08190 [Dehalococcoidia bacterium]|nr:hypothetical protein [Dehalococcoidia bacterium]
MHQGTTAVRPPQAGQARTRHKQGERHAGDAIVLGLREAIAGGRHWYPALLEAVGQWTAPEEVYQGRGYCYLIENEAFDWLLLAERLCQEIEDLAPEQERNALLFLGRPPLPLGKDEFRRLLGPAKYRGYLNYYYGVMAEGSLQMAEKEELRKELQSRCCAREARLLDEVFLKVYGADHDTMLGRFRKKKGYPAADSISLTELHEFTYWLFKYRMANSDPARIASDTRKGLLCLRRLHPEAEA